MAECLLTERWEPAERCADFRFDTQSGGQLLVVTSGRMEQGPSFDSGAPAVIQCRLGEFTPAARKETAVTSIQHQPEFEEYRLSR